MADEEYIEELEKVNKAIRKCINKIIWVDENIGAYEQIDNTKRWLKKVRKEIDDLIEELELEKDEEDDNDEYFSSNLTDDDSSRISFPTTFSGGSFGGGGSKF